MGKIQTLAFLGDGGGRTVGFGLFFLGGGAFNDFIAEFVCLFVCFFSDKFPSDAALL